MDTKYAGTLRSSRKDKRLGYSDNIYDKELGAMQSELNKRFGEKGDASKIYDNEQGKTQAEINKEANGYFYGVSVSTSDGNTTLSMSSRNGDKSVSLLGKLLTSINDSSLGGKLPSGNGYLRYSNGTWEIGNPSVSGGGAALGGFLTKLNADNPSLLENGFLTYRNGSFYMVEVKADGGGSSSGGTVSQDQIDTAVKDALSNYSWWGRYFASGNNSITGALIGVPSIQFNNGKNVEKLLYLDDNGDLCFNGNFYTTGGISALGKSDTSSGGSSGGGNGYPFTIYKNESDTVGVSNAYGAMSLRIGSGLTATVSGRAVTLSSNGLINVYWDEINDKPDTFTPSEHTHKGVDITDLANYLTWGTISGKPSTFTPSAHKHTTSEITDFASKLTWGSILNKPSTFTPSSHTHTASEITDLASKLVWDNITEKPLTFTPSAHTHKTSEIIDLSAFVKATKVDNASHADNADNANLAYKATMLATTRLIWGQDFNGTANVSGSMSGVGSINLSGYINVSNSLTSGTLMTLTYNSKSILGFNSNKDLFIGYGYYQDTDAHITLYGSKTLINTYDGSKNHAFWFRDNYLSMPDDGELRIGNGKIVWDEDNKAFRMTSTNGGDCNFYCDGGITALGIQSTTASNGSFAFKNVSADNLNLKKQYGYGLSFGNKLAIWGASEDAALHVGDAMFANWAQVYVTYNTVFSPAQIYTLSNIVTDGGYVEIRNSTLRIKYSGTTYELNVSKAISAGILTAASTQSLEDSPIINELS